MPKICNLMLSFLTLKLLSLVNTVALHTHMHARTHAHTHTHAHTPTHAHTHIYNPHPHPHAQTHTCTHTMLNFMHLSQNDQPSSLINNNLQAKAFPHFTHDITDHCDLNSQIGVITLRNTNSENYTRLSMTVIWH